MISKDQLRELRKGNLYSADGEKIGSIDEIYLDDQTNQPEWVTVNTGLFGTSTSFVPMDGATVTDDGLTVQYSKDTVKDAPRVDADQHLSAEEEQELFRYYGRGEQGLAAGTAAAGTGLAGDRGADNGADGAADRGADLGADGTADRGADGGADGGADLGADGTADRGADGGADGAADRNRAAGVDVERDSMVRHEERLNVGTQTERSGGLRLRKYVDEEQQTVSVPVETESAHVVRRPVDGDVTTDGNAFREEEVSVELESERPVVSKETVAVEEVGIEKERRTENVEVSDTVRSERIEVEGDDVDGTRR